MGKVIIRYTNNKLESLNCKSEDRAAEIAAKRKNVSSWNYFPTGMRIPAQKKTKNEDKPLTLEQMEDMLQRSSIW